MNDIAAVAGLSDEEYQAKKEKTQAFLSENGVQICLVVTAVASVGILLATRKSNRIGMRALKQSTRFLNDTQNEAHMLRKAITELKQAGLEFSYYPGLGVFEDHKLPQLAAKTAGSADIAKAREALEMLRSLRGAA